MKRFALSIAVLGWVLFISSFFLPAIVTVNNSVLGYQVVWHLGFPGWVAAVVGFGSLDDVRSEPLRAIISFVAALTNIVVVVSPWAVLKPSSRLARWLPMAALLALIVNASVPVVVGRDTVLGLGYRVWVVSFLAVAVGAYLARPRQIRGLDEASRPWVA